MTNLSPAEIGKFHLVGLTSDILVDDVNEGEGESTGCGYGGEKVGLTFDSFGDMLKHLSSHYGLSSYQNDYGTDTDGRLETSRSVANHSEAQNGGWFEPTEAEFAQWHAGELKLYVENFDITYHRVG